MRAGHGDERYGRLFLAQVAPRASRHQITGEEISSSEDFFLAAGRDERFRRRGRLSMQWGSTSVGFRAKEDGLNTLSSRRRTRRPWLRTGAAILALTSFSAVTACGVTTPAEHSRADAAVRASRLGHPEIEYRELLSPGTAIALGLLPFGPGGFYVNDMWLGLSGFLWLFSMIWLPRMAYDKAVDRNDGDFERRMMEVLEQRPSEE